MATVTTNFSSATSLNTALVLVNSGWSLSSALSWASAAFTSESDVAYFTSLSSSYVSGRFVNSDDFQMWGSNLTGDPATTTQLDYLFNPEGITVSVQGNIVTYGDFTQSGYINNIIVSSAAYGSISVVVYANVAIDADGTITSVIWDVGGAHMVANGVLTANEEISGYYTGATISYAGSTYAINNIAFDAKASFATLEEMLSAVLSGEDSIDGSVGSDYLNGYAGNDTLDGGSGSDGLDGGLGIDTAIFHGVVGQYSISLNRATHTAVVTDSQSGRDGTDTLINVEKLQFGSQTFDLLNPDFSMPQYAQSRDFLFDASYYLLSHPELASTVTLQTAFNHYLTTGAALGYKPNSWFDTTYYENRWSDLKAGNFDDATLFLHYNLYGVWEGRSAGNKFEQYDGVRYLHDNPDVAAYVDGHIGDFLGSRTNGAIAHYIIYGEAEGRVAYDLQGAQIDPVVLIGVPEPI